MRIRPVSLCPAANWAPHLRAQGTVPRRVCGAYARARCPGEAWIAGELPKGPTGKIVKPEIVLPDDLGL
jgi:hypothetical protein